MTDQIPAEDVREIVEKMRYHANQKGVVGGEEEYVRFFADRLDALLPPPPRPTLADRTEEERAACQWMQIEETDEGVRCVIAHPCDEDGDVAILSSTGRITWLAAAQVTPRPDLPRMEWPGDTTHKGPKVTFSMPAPTAPVKVGDVIESADDPRIAALPVGSMLIDRDGGVFDVTKNYTGEWDGPGYVPAQGTGTKWGPWTVRRIGLGADQ